MKGFDHGGQRRKLAQAIGCREEELLDFSASINPLGPPEWLRRTISSQVGALVDYPDPECFNLLSAISGRHSVSPEELAVGSGTTELLFAIPRALDVRQALIPVPAYSDYARAARLAGLELSRIMLKEEEGFTLELSRLAGQLRGDELVFLGHPDNPTGMPLDAPRLRELAGTSPKTFFVVDEAFADFVEGIDSLIHNRPPNVIVLRSLTKFFAIPGLRTGYAVGHPDCMDRIRPHLLPWSVSTLAQAVGERAIRDEGYAARSRTFTRERREALVRELNSIGCLSTYPGTANYLLVRIDRPGMKARTLAEKLLQGKIAIRVCETFEGLDERFFRVAVRTESENRKLCQALREALDAPGRRRLKRRKPAIMLQGTASSVGKSTMTAAFCRLLLQDGYAVAPFKAQNMALNSFVTRDAKEMGRAQVVQAQACRLEPDVRMNPVLLKPCSETGSQVVVLGEPVATMDHRAYIEYKPKAFEAVKESYDSLSRDFEVIVLEGAGSPAEINLKKHDLTNMAIARYAEARVILVGDIDRGGVFASLVGTMELLDEHERSLVEGYIINRFRGIEALLGNACRYIEEQTRRPVFGVVPYLRELGLPEEDSVAFKSGLYHDASPLGDRIDVALIDLPQISNFTDLDPFRREPDVRLRVVRTASELGNPDLVILPGSKSVISDLKFLTASGLAVKIVERAREKRTEVVGICGGYQMLGREIRDPACLESQEPRCPGLALLPIATEMLPRKRLARIEAVHVESGLRVSGYEIHHGESEHRHLTPAVRGESGELLGGGLEDLPVWGTYLHGLFDADAFRRWFIDRARVRRGLPAREEPGASFDFEAALDRLAEVVRRHVRMPDIYQAIGL